MILVTNVGRLKGAVNLDFRVFLSMWLWEQVKPAGISSNLVSVIYGNMK